MPDVRWDEESIRFGLHHVGLNTGRRGAPDRQPTVGVMIIEEHHEALLLPDEESRPAVAEPLRGLRQSQTGQAYGGQCPIDVLGGIARLSHVDILPGSVGSMNPLLAGLCDDASLDPHDRHPMPDIAAWRDTWYAPVIGSLVVPDDSLTAVSRGLDEGAPVRCRVINTGGAGGLIGLAKRRLDRLRVTSVRTALRDLDDLAGATARVAVAARELDPEITVLVELPTVPAWEQGSGWERVIETIELEGLSAAIADNGDPAQIVTRLSALIEADVPFVITGPITRAERLTELIMIVYALIEGTTPEEASASPPVGPPPQDATDRIRRRVIGVETASIPEMIPQLANYGWLTRP